MSAQDQLPDFSMNSDGLYHEDVISDRRVGSIRRMTPVTASGEVDSQRAVIYTGHTQVMTPAGALPLVFEIDAQSLEEAVKQFGDAAQEALEQTMQELREMQRDAASSIVVPGRNPGFDPKGGMPGGGSGSGGIPGGGLHMP